MHEICMDHWCARCDLPIVSHTKTYARVRRLLQCILQHNWTFHSFWDPFLGLWPNRFHKLCQYATCGNREERAVTANFSDRAMLCILADGRLRSNMPVYLLFLLLLQQSDHLTTVGRGTAGILNGIWHSSIGGVPITFLKKSGFTSGREQWSWIARMYASVLSPFLCQQVSKRTPFGPNQKTPQPLFSSNARIDVRKRFPNMNKHHGQTDFHGQDPSTSWTCGPGLCTFMNLYTHHLWLLGISFAVCHNIPSPMWISSGSDLFFSLDWWLESNRSQMRGPVGQPVATDGALEPKWLRNSPSWGSNCVNPRLTRIYHQWCRWYPWPKQQTILIPGE